MTWSRSGLIDEMSAALWESVSQSRNRAPAPARQAADDLAKLYEAVNDTDLAHIATRLDRAANGIGPAEVGDLLVSYAMGAGASWGDVVARAGVRVPTFSADLQSRDGKLELVWDGGAEVQNPPRKAPTSTALGPRILLLEDDPVLQAGTSRMLGRLFKGTPILVSDNVDAAIANVKVHDVSLIVSDVDVLGDKSGIDFFHWIQENRPELVDSFVFFTGNSAAEHEHYRYLPKGGVVAKDLKEVILRQAPTRDTDRTDRDPEPPKFSARSPREVKVERPANARMSAPPAARPRPTKTGATRADFLDMKRQEREAAEYDRLLDAPQQPKPCAACGSTATHDYMTGHLYVKPGLVPHPGAFAADFARDFEAAFRRLDNGHNYVLLYDLRRALPQYSREEFTEGVNDMRRSKLLSLDTADGRHVHLTDAQLTGGIREGESNLQYATYRQRLAPGATAAPAPRQRSMPIEEFAHAVNETAKGIEDEAVEHGQARGRFGDKVFIAAIWRHLENDPRFADMTLADFKKELLVAHRERLVTMARADLVAVMDHNEVIESEIHDRGATFNFVVADQRRQPMTTHARQPAPARVSPRPASRQRLTHAGDLASAVIEAARQTDDERRGGRAYGRFGDKVFISAVWRKLQGDPVIDGMSYEQFKKKLVSLNLAGKVILARADLVGAMDPSEVSESETRDRGATFHFVLSERR